ncbi:MAG: dTDP-glucose 4,6-dehydratase [Muribaculaceae bacterium]|nr:dTDP-glucose 4,6-dehydratase [Muribaculaceae bacterium]
MSTGKDTYLVTGAAGFIGSAFVRMLAAGRHDISDAASQAPGDIIVLDALTYAGNLDNISDLIESGAITFIKGDIRDEELVAQLLDKYEPAYVVNFAAETHVDRSVDGPEPFISTNINGVFNLLECMRRQARAQSEAGREPSLRRFVQVSTDEVYGDLEIGAEEHYPCGSLHPHRAVVTYGHDAFSESTPLNPSSPYSASKASADFLALSYFRSFGLPVTITRCSNNYGPRQFPEKLIPLMVNNVLFGRPLPVYGAGLNVRDWIHVDDHCRGILAALHRGLPGRVYNFGGYSERRNIDIVRTIIDIIAATARHDDAVADRFPAAVDASDELITFVTDRPGHDRRYAIDASCARAELDWTPQMDFRQGLEQTVRWYIDHYDWVKRIVDGEYREYYKHMYENR